MLRSSISRPGQRLCLQGYVNYNSNDQMGWFYMNDKGSTTFVWADQLTLNLSPMMFGWMRNDRICGISSLLNGGQLYTYQYVEMNPENGEYLVNKAVNLKNDDGSINYLNYYRTAAYDPALTASTDTGTMPKETHSCSNPRPPTSRKRR